jgi:hypothetical protein
MGISWCRDPQGFQHQLNASSEEKKSAKLTFEQYALSTGSKLFTTTATLGNTMTMPSAKHATTQDRSSPFVG